jgi:hypothetical protein
LTSTLPGDWHTVDDCPVAWHDLVWLSGALRGAAAIAAATAAVPISVANTVVIVGLSLSRWITSGLVMACGFVETSS